MSYLPKKKYHKTSVIELIEKAQQDDRNALEELIKRHEKIVYITLYNLSAASDISDLTQEVLLKVARSIKSLKNPLYFKFWLNQIITNVFYDDLRKKRRKLFTLSLDSAKVFDEEEQTIEICDDKDIPDKTTMNKELEELIRKEIQKLPEHFRVTIVLRELQGLNYDEIAKLTSASIGTVKSRLARARAKLQKNLEPYLK